VVFEGSICAWQGSALAHMWSVTFVEPPTTV
jgi:hypothetical protein